MQLRDLIEVATAVREGAVAWSAEIGNMLEYLPVTTVGGRPGIDFSSLQMQSVYPPRADPQRYEGQPVIAEMNVSGTVAGTAYQFVYAGQSVEYGVCSSLPAGTVVKTRVHVQPMSALWAAPDRFLVPEAAAA